MSSSEYEADDVSANFIKAPVSKRKLHGSRRPWRVLISTRRHRLLRRQQSICRTPAPQCPVCDGRGRRWRCWNENRESGHRCAWVTAADRQHRSNSARRDSHLADWPMARRQGQSARRQNSSQGSKFRCHAEELLQQSGALPNPRSYCLGTPGLAVGLALKARRPQLPAGTMLLMGSFRSGHKVQVAGAALAS